MSFAQTRVTMSNVTENKIVRVVKEGRGKKEFRVPVGTEGLVKRVFSNSWGTLKLVVIDENGNKFWPTASQVEVIDDNPDLSVWIERDIHERKKSGFPVIGTVKVISRYGKAAFVRLSNADELWIPFSQVPELSGVKKGTTLSIWLPLWFATQKGIYKKR